MFFDSTSMAFRKISKHTLVSFLDHFHNFPPTPHSGNENKIGIFVFGLLYKLGMYLRFKNDLRRNLRLKTHRNQKINVQKCEH